MDPGTESLAPGDVLSYSAGSTQTGPYGFRKLRARRSLLAAVGERWPEVPAAVGDRTLMFINGYPAAIGTLPGAISVDTYLSARVMSRALQLGRVENHPVVVAAQPLFLAHALYHHVAADRPLPETLLLWVGGYVMPQSLERALVETLEDRVRALHFVQFFGAAEVDAGCFMGRDRTSEGQLIYHPRTDVEPALDGADGDELVLTLRNPDGSPVIERFATGDCARQHGDGWVIWNHRRLHPDVERELESWTSDDWSRRTGYVRRADDTIWVQLRAGQSPTSDAEVEHHEFARRFRFAWLEKPYWR